MIKMTRFFYELSERTPQHGDHPFKVAHIDHAKLDIELVCSIIGEDLGAPWASFMTDAFTRRLLAVDLSFDQPNTQSCMAMFRECVAQHQRLPEMIVIDTGKEFKQSYLATFLSRYEITRRRRPPSHRHSISVCERLFGVTNTSFVDELTADAPTDNMETSANNGPAWTLKALSMRLREWAYQIYDVSNHPALGQSPREAFNNAKPQSSAPPNQRILHDVEFEALTLPTTARGTARVNARREVKINYLYYWSYWFGNNALQGIDLPVRYDPYDLSHAYVCINGAWRECNIVSDGWLQFHIRSHRELEIGVEALRRRNQGSGNRLVISTDRLAEFLASYEGRELISKQRDRDRETRESRDQARISRMRPNPLESEESDEPFEPEIYGRY